MRILSPIRGPYRKTQHLIKSCPFCDADIIKQQGIPELETKYWRVLACKYPYLDGNLMLIPKRHTEHTTDLTSEEWNDFPLILKKSQNALSKLFETDSYNLGLNIGPESGRSLAHLHWMLLPRTSKMRNVPVLESIHDLIVVTMDHKTLIKRIRALFKKQKKRR